MPGESTNSQTNPTKNRLKVLIGVLVGAVLGVILTCFGLLFYLTQQGVNIFTIVKDAETQQSQTDSQKDETADWRVYTNKDSGIKFKAPSNWKEDNRGADGSISIYYKGDAGTGIESDGAMIRNGITVSYKDSLKNYIDKNTVDTEKFNSGGYSPGDIFENIKETTLGGKLVYLGDALSEDGQAKVAYVDLGDGTAATFILITKNVEDFEETFELVISTVKLIR
ncbi:MAG: PsbP-related protein [Candidatus Woykebacteria bacterium]